MATTSLPINGFYANRWGVFTLLGILEATAMVSSWNGLGTHFAVARAMEKNGFNAIKWECSH